MTKGSATLRPLGSFFGSMFCWKRGTAEFLATNAPSSSVAARTACDFASPDRAGFHWPVLDLADDCGFGFEATAINKPVGMRRTGVAVMRSPDTRVRIIPRPSSAARARKL